MKKHHSLFLIFFGLTFICMGLARENNKITIWMIGDSTMSIKDESKFPETGWGVPFSLLFDEDILVENRAANGRSTRSFIAEKRWQSVHDSIKKGDYVFIQFGHNDEKTDRPSVGTSIYEYKKNLTFFVECIKEKQAIPILLTPIARRRFENGTLIDTHGAYPQAVRSVADSLGITLIDMTHLTDNLLRELGEKESRKLFLHVDPGHINYPQGIADNTHLNNTGATIFANIVAQEIKNRALPLSNHMKN